MCPQLPRRTVTAPFLQRGWDAEELGYSQRGAPPAVLPRALPQRLGSHKAPLREGESLPRSSCADLNSAPRLFQAPIAPWSPAPSATPPPGQDSRSLRARSGTRSRAHVALELLAGNPGPTSGLRSIGQKSAKHFPRLREAHLGRLRVKPARDSQSRRLGSPLGDPQI